jgi:hypothetical protein
MTHESASYPGMQITTDRSESSYNIPVVVYNGKVYGDADIIETTIEDCDDYIVTKWTGKDAKRTIAEREAGDDEKLYTWITKGAELKSFTEYKNECKGYDSFFAK